MYSSLESMGRLICLNKELMIIDNQDSLISSRPSLKAPHPSLTGGYSLIYDNRIPIDMKYLDYDRNVNQLGTNELVNFKIYSFGSKPNMAKFKLEIESDSDPFFIAKFECDQHLFQSIRKQQKLNITLQQLPTIIIKCLNKIEQATKKLNANLLIYSDGKSKLCLNHSSEFKNIQIISLDLVQEADDKLQEIISFKYQALRKKIEKTELRLEKINQILKEKNPSLLLQIYKSTKK